MEPRDIPEVLNLLRAATRNMVVDDYDARIVAPQYWTRGLGISTCLTSDQGFETAILDAKGTYPVERYATKEEAIAGHKIWTRRVIAGLEKIRQLGYGSIVPEKLVMLNPKVLLPGRPSEDFYKVIVAGEPEDREVPEDEYR